MDKEMKEMLTWINENLKTVVDNQYILCYQLKKIGDELEKKIDNK